MAQSNKGRTIAIAVITVSAVISVLLVMAVVYLFFQVNHLQEENKNLRSKWQKLEAIHPENDQNTNTDSKQKQKKTVEICCGAKGKRRRSGVKGDRGEKGDPGREGRYGPIGVPGQPGKDGMKGEKGSAGSPGVKGDQGICSGSCGQNLMANKKDTPLLHMTGDGRQDKRINNLEASAVAFWNVTETAGDITYSKGYLTINVEGFYYIYSQMAYCGKKERQVGHTMSINSNTVLKSTLTAKDEGTHNVGSIFKLKKGDKITVSPLITNLVYCFSREEAYFGAFLVRN